jgi:hypothetical protein
MSGNKGRAMPPTGPLCGATPGADKSSPPSRAAAAIAGEPDERGIDLAIMAYFGAIMTGEPRDVAARNAEAMLELFGFERTSGEAA